MSSPRPPSPLALLGECRIALEWVHLRAALPRLRAEAPRGCGQPVMVVPGFATDDSWTSSLRGFLAAIGYHAQGWGLGRNRGDVHRLIPALTDAVDRLAVQEGAAVRLVGWSLGGYLAREVAREQRPVVERVVTLGAPVVGGPKYTASAPAYRRRGVDLDAVEAQVEARESVPIQVPVAAVYSRSDGVVDWRACIDWRSPCVEHHEVGVSHLGLIASAETFRLVAELLGRTLVPQRPRIAVGARARRGSALEPASGVAR